MYSIKVNFALKISVVVCTMHLMNIYSAIHPDCMSPAKEQERKRAHLLEQLLLLGALLPTQEHERYRACQCRLPHCDTRTQAHITTSCHHQHACESYRCAHDAGKHSLHPLQSHPESSSSAQVRLSSCTQ